MNKKFGAILFRSSRSQIFFKIGLFKNFAIFIEKDFRWTLFLIKLQTWRVATWLKRDSHAGILCEYWEICKIIFSCRTTPPAAASYYSLWTFGNLNVIPEFLGSGRLSWTLDPRHWTLDAGLWTLDSGRWTLDVGLWTLDSGHWTLDAGLWALDPGHCRWLL